MKALPKQHRDKVVKKYLVWVLEKCLKLWKSYWAPLNHPSQNGKNMAPQQTCLEGAVHKDSLTRQGEEELECSTEENGVSVHRTIINHILHTPYIFHLACRRLAKKALRSDATKVVLAIKKNAMSGANPLPLIKQRKLTPKWSMAVKHHAVEMFFISADWKTGQNSGSDGWCKILVYFSLQSSID